VVKSSLLKVLVLVLEPSSQLLKELNAKFLPKLMKNSLAELVKLLKHPKLPKLSTYQLKKNQIAEDLKMT
jgi:hypothetical protein